MFQCATLIWLCRSRPSARRALRDSEMLRRALSGRSLGLLYMVTLLREQTIRPRAHVASASARRRGKLPRGSLLEQEGDLQADAIHARALVLELDLLILDPDAL